jgi:hypothetical protein
MKPYQLTLQFPERTMTVPKELKNDKDALKWANLCLDICGKDEHGRRYLIARLVDGAGKELPLRVRPHPLVRT